MKEGSLCQRDRNSPARKSSRPETCLYLFIFSKEPLSSSCCCSWKVLTGKEQKAIAILFISWMLLLFVYMERCVQSNRRKRGVMGATPTLRHRPSTTSYTRFAHPKSESSAPALCDGESDVKHGSLRRHYVSSSRPLVRECLRNNIHI